MRAQATAPKGKTSAAIGGLLFSTVFTLVMIPVFHYGVVTLAERLGLKTIPPRVEFEG